MNANRILYRTRQFWQALGASLTLGASLAPEDRDLVQALLTPGQIALFEGMQESEQAHALRVLHALLEQGEEHPDLSVAALLHDVGKSRFPLKLWERILIVLGQAFFPERAARWGAAAENAAWVQGSGCGDRSMGARERGSRGVGELGSEPRSGDLGHRMAQNLRRAFVVAERHAEWGAEMAAGAGASRMAVTLIRRHQDDLDRLGERGSSLEQDLLRKLQSVDDHS